MKLSVVIVNWNAKEYLERCLSSIKEHVGIIPDDEYEVLVIDNASIDGSNDMVREKFAWVCLIESPENLGFARANNVAMRQASGEYILLLNPDTEIKPDSIDNLLKAFIGIPDVGIVGPRLLNTDGSLQESCYPFPTVLKEFWRLFLLDSLVSYGKYHMRKWNQREPRKVDYIQGACILARRKDLEKIGFFDTDFFIYTEELDLCYRMKKSGFSCYWIPSAEVVHHGGKSTRQSERAMFLMLYQTKLLYFKKQYGKVNEFFYKIVILSASLARIILAPLLAFLRPAHAAQYKRMGNFYQALFRCILQNRYT